MKVVNVLTLLTVMLIIFMSSTPTLNAATLKEEDDDVRTSPAFEHTGPESHFHITRGFGRFLSQQKARAPRTCDKYPRICRAKGSGGPDCCKKQCVDTAMDRLNCGKCGHKCKYTETCCEGHCVNLSYNNGHCGKCNNRCKRGSSCVYGLCSYA